MVARYGKKRLSRRPRRYRRRNMRLSRKTRLTQGKVYAFKRSCQLSPFVFQDGSWQQSTGGNAISNDSSLVIDKGIFKFRLSDLPNYTDFTNMYEQFKITGVKLRFIPNFGTESSSTASAYTEAFAYCIDRGANDYVNTAITFDGLLEHQDVKIRTSQRGTINLWIGAPSAHQPADAVIQSAYVRPWLDSDQTSSVNVDHHGLKFAFQTVRPTANANRFKVYATYYVKCRNPQ